MYTAASTAMWTPFLRQQRNQSTELHDSDTVDKTRCRAAGVWGGWGRKPLGIHTEVQWWGEGGPPLPHSPSRRTKNRGHSALGCDGVLRPNCSRLPARLGRLLSFVDRLQSPFLTFSGGKAAGPAYVTGCSSRTMYSGCDTCSPRILSGWPQTGKLP